MAVTQRSKDVLHQRTQQFAAFVLCWAVLLLTSFAANANISGQTTDPLRLDASLTRYADAKDHLEYFSDPALTQTAASVMSEPARFAPITSRFADFGLTDDRIWMKWDAINISGEPQVFRIDLKRQYFTELKLYEAATGEPPTLLLDHRQEDSFSKRAIPSRFLLTDVAFTPGETKTFVVGYRSSTTTFLPVAMGTVDAVLANHQDEMSTDVFLNGMLVAMIIYSLLMLPVIGWRLAASFAGYIGAGAFYVFVADGYPMQLLWPHSAWLNEPMNLASMLLMTAFGLHFCRELFEFKAFSAKFDAVLRTGFWLAALCVPLSFVLIGYRWFTVPAYFLPPLANICVCVAGIVAYRNARIGAFPFLCGALLVFSSLVYATAAHLIPGRFNLDATLDFGHFALFGECLAFAFAILVRFLSIRKQRDEALAAKLEATEQRLKLSEQLMTSQKNFEEAKSHAMQRQRRLSDLSHDIRQPLLVLKDAVSRLGQYEEHKDARLEEVIDYLDNVTGAQDYENESGEGAATQQDHGGTERFQVGVLFQSIEQLYSERALKAGTTLKFRNCDLEINGNPIALMRVLSNLVDNAITHGKGTKVLLAARRRGGRIRLEIWNNGEGLAPGQLQTLKQRGAKGDSSTGVGLGLNIIERICHERGYDFEFRSDEGTGSAALVWL